MIWTTSHLSDETISNINKSSESTITKHTSPKLSCETLNFAVIGGGPKGMYAIDNFIVALMQQPSVEHVAIYWYNKDQYFGAGPNYTPKQDENLLINYCIGNINAWKENTNQRLCFTDWLKLHTKSDTAVSPYDYASRALVGYYLMDCCQRIIHDCPHYVTIHCIAEEVHDIAYEGEKLAVQQQQFESIILCTGHSFQNETIHNPHADMVFNSFPIKNLEKIIHTKQIAIRGLGLSFIDTVLYISENTTTADCPTMYPYSRTNLPMIPRRAELIKKDGFFYFPDYWQSISSKAVLDFDQDILPMMRTEIKMAYYAAHIRSNDNNKIKAYIDSIPKSKSFELDDLLFPNQSLSKSEKENYTEWIQTYLQAHLNRCQQIPDQDPLNSAIQMLTQFRPILTSCYAHRKLTPESHQRFDTHWYPAISRVCFGPPIANVEKLLTLIAKGKLKFEFTECPSINISNNMIELKGNGKKINCEVLIHAQIPRAALSKNNHALFGNLVEKGLATPFRNGYYAPGGIAINKEGKVLNSLEKNIPLFAYGTPTEGCVLDNDTLSRSAHDFSLAWIHHNKTLLTLKSLTSSFL